MGSWAGLRTGSEILHFENSRRHTLVNELVPGKWCQFTNDTPVKSTSVTRHIPIHGGHS